jgi:hypothetical protein
MGKSAEDGTRDGKVDGAWDREFGQTNGPGPPVYGEGSPYDVAYDKAYKEAYGEK